MAKHFVCQYYLEEKPSVRQVFCQNHDFKEKYTFVVLLQLPKSRPVERKYSWFFLISITATIMSKTINLRVRLKLGFLILTSLFTSSFALAQERTIVKVEGELPFPTDLSIFIPSGLSAGQGVYHYYEEDEEGNLFPKRVLHGAYEYRTPRMSVKGQYTDGQKSGRWYLNDLEVHFRGDTISCQVDDHRIWNNRDEFPDWPTYTQKEIRRRFTIRENRFYDDLELSYVVSTIDRKTGAVQEITTNSSYRGQFDDQGWAHGKHQYIEGETSWGKGYRRTALYHHGYILADQSQDVFSGEITNHLSNSTLAWGRLVKENLDPQSRKITLPGASSDVLREILMTQKLLEQPDPHEDFGAMLHNRQRLISSFKDVDGIGLLEYVTIHSFCKEDDMSLVLLFATEPILKAFCKE